MSGPCALAFCIQPCQCPWPSLLPPPTPHLGLTLSSPCRGARLIPEMDQIFTEVEMTTLEKVINETWVITTFPQDTAPEGRSAAQWEDEGCLHWA